MVPGTLDVVVVRWVIPSWPRPHVSFHLCVPQKRYYWITGRDEVLAMSTVAGDPSWVGLHPEIFRRHYDEGNFVQDLSTVFFHNDQSLVGMLGLVAKRVDTVLLRHVWEWDETWEVQRKWQAFEMDRRKNAF